MATMIITEYGNIGVTGHGWQIPIPSEPAIAEQTLTFTTTTQSAEFSSGTAYVRIVADADCHVRFGSDPTATTSHQPLAADTEYFRAVRQDHKVAAVTA